MDYNIIHLIIVSVVLLCIGLIILLGKGDWMISQYKRLSPEERAKYNITRLRIVCSVLLIYIAIALLVCHLLGANEVITTTTILAPTIIGVILSYTWCKY